jgi:predicted Rossmann fold flavoprotein
MDSFDLIVVGAGAAGLFCAGVAGQLGKKVLIIDHSDVIGEKIRISGGGRCNFTNVHCGPNNFLSMNPHFVKSALSRYSSQDFIDLVKKYGIAFHEKHKGQLFCDKSAKEIVQMLLSECELGKVKIQYPEEVQTINQSDSGWLVETNLGNYISTNLVMATGGLPVPAIGASDFALKFAEKLGIPVIATRPALVPLAFTSGIFSKIEDFAGISFPVQISAGMKKVNYGTANFAEDLLITHKGLSGPAVLQASSYWQEGEPVQIEWLNQEKWETLTAIPENRLKTVDQLLTEFFPTKLAKEFSIQLGLTGVKWAEVSNKNKELIINHLCKWSIKPAGTLGWNKAEVMVGGIDTKALEGKTMMAKKYPGLFFIGECVDVTGHLGGHNFQWAWASAYVCANSLIESHSSVDVVG